MTPIDHAGQRLFAGLPAPMPVGRYHSLVVTPGPDMARHLSVDAVSQEAASPTSDEFARIVRFEEQTQPEA